MWSGIQFSFFVRRAHQAPRRREAASECAEVSRPGAYFTRPPPTTTVPCAARRSGSPRPDRGHTRVAKRRTVGRRHHAGALPAAAWQPRSIVEGIVHRASRPTSGAPVALRLRLDSTLMPPPGTLLCLLPARWATTLPHSSGRAAGPWRLARSRAPVCASPHPPPLRPRSGRRSGRPSLRQEASHAMRRVCAHAGSRRPPPPPPGARAARDLARSAPYRHPQ